MKKLKKHLEDISEELAKLQDLFNELEAWKRVEIKSIVMCGYDREEDQFCEFSFDLPELQKNILEGSITYLQLEINNITRKVSYKLGITPEEFKKDYLDNAL